MKKTNIRIYLDRIDSLFAYHVKHYRVNVATNRFKEGELFTSSKLAELENYFSNPFSDNLKWFLDWSGRMPVWMAPFIPFEKDAKNFHLWTNRFEIIELLLNKEGEYEKKLQIMNGNFELDNTKYIFRINVDVDGVYTDKKESVFLEHGIVKPEYAKDFNDLTKVTLFKLTNSIEEFLTTYLEFLQSLPIKVKPLKKIDTLLKDTKKLFHFAEKYNWDDGIDKLEYIVNSKECDLATALLIYWSSQPYFYEEETGKKLKLLPFIIEENIKNNFYSKSANNFDPTNDRGHDFIEGHNKTSKKRDIPEFMLKLKV